ncbi:MAG: ribulokinase [Chloroflexaceae bacterium]|nr:ribulokinase [Chloroflexaceae bacterium]
MQRYALGLDFGTESARALLADVATGTSAASAAMPFPHGVIDRCLPDSDEPLPPEWALQDPRDWLTTLEGTVRQVLQQSGVRAEQVVGIGLDFTACTVAPTLADGTPLHMLAAHRARPHAWAKLWKHHGAQPQADRMNALALERGEGWLARYGGKISSEWLIPKALQLLEEAPDLYAAAARIVEGADWVVWQLTGNLARNACAAGYKGTWNKSQGQPSTDFLAALHPGLANLFTDKVSAPVVAPGSRVGGLTAAWAGRLGLQAGTPVAAGIIDAHAAVPGGGVSGTGTLFMIMGTSTCHMLMAEHETLAEGISGVVEDGILPGLFGYEAGQAGVGDIFGWFVDAHVPPAYHQAAAREGRSLHDLLASRAAAMRPGQSGLLALDWWNGCRTPLVDADLGGLVLGYTLQTTPEALYRALIEATAFGTRLIVETFQQAGVPVRELRAGGGLIKNELLLQVYADVLQLPIAICANEQASALGAAMFGALAGGAHASIAEAVAAMAQPCRRTAQPNAAHAATYSALYTEYLRLVEFFGRNAASPLKRVRALRG